MSIPAGSATGADRPPGPIRPAARWRGIGFSITDNFGALGVLVIVLMVGAGAIVVTWLLAAARQDRRQLLGDPDEPGGPDL